MVGYKAFTLIPNDWLTDEAWVKARLPRSSKNCVYSAGFLVRSEGFRGTSGNIRLNAAPLAVSGSSSDQSFGWVSSFLAEGSGSGVFTSSGIITAPYVSTSGIRLGH